MRERTPFPLLAGVRALLERRRRTGGVDADGSGAALSTTETPCDPLDQEEQLILSELGKGARLGSYVIERLIARGGMAWVFQARRLADDAPVALKVLRPRLAARSEFLDIFQREADGLAELDHPNVVSVFGRGVAQELHFMVMEYIDGASLEHLLLAGVELDVRQRLHLLREVCAGVAYLHSHGIVHGDLKPANVLVGHDGAVKLTDFGLARWLWESAQNNGFSAARCCTPAYAAPEILRGGEPTPASDIFALGVTFYKLFTGSFPWRPELLEMGYCHPPVQGEAESCGEGEPMAAADPASHNGNGRHAGSQAAGDWQALQAVLERALAPEPADRYPTVGHLWAAVEFALNPS